MDLILHQLGGILRNSVPTFLIVLFLVIYLRGMFFKPIARLLAERYEATEGARKAAEESMRNAERQIAEYEEKLRAARGEIYAEQAQALKAVEAENAAQLERTRREAETQIARAHAQLLEESEQARRSLESRSSELADQIVARILEGRAA
jgi:F0F1-type ATP synthase membrane subunit b/b'